MRKYYACAVLVASALTAFSGVGRANTVALAFATTAVQGVVGSWSLSTGTTPQSGTSYALNSLSNVLFKTLTVTGDPISGDNQAYNITGDGTGSCTNTAGGTLVKSAGGLTLYGVITGLTGLSTCTALETLNGSFTGTYIANNSGQFTFAGLTSITQSTQLLNDLGLSTGFSGPSLGSGAGINSTGGTLSGGVDTYTSSSEQFTVNLTQTPEPFSFGLMGVGLAALIVKARKKSSRAV